MQRRYRRFLLPYGIGCFYDVALSHARPSARTCSDFREDPHRVLESIRHLLHTLYDVEGLVRWGGPLLVWIVVFVETGFFVGFFLPGDSLLVTAGVFAATGSVHLAKLLLLVPLCAIVGDQIGYWIGRKAGSALYSREDSFLFRKRHLERAHQFY